MQLVKDKPVLFIGAHTDDIELFAGGLSSRLKREGVPQHWITFSSHREVTDYKQAREEHCQNAAYMAGKGNFDVLDYGACNGEFQQNRKYIYDIILRWVRKLKPQFVVTHPWDTNQDHQQIISEALRSLKGEVSLLSGEYPFNDLGTSGLPNLYFKLEEEDVKNKIALILNYKSQYAPHRHYFKPDVWRGLQTLRGAQIGADFAEAYFVNRLTVV